jgi:lyso-ornithine lipid O-acyltransferase
MKNPKKNVTSRLSAAHVAICKNMSTLRGTLKMTLFALWTIILVPLQMIVRIFYNGPYSFIVPKLWHKGIRHILAISYEVHGTQNKGRQTLYMCNHLSYLDIPVLGSIITGSFVAKSEVQNWPVFGFLAKLQQTAFIERKKTAIVGAKSSIEKTLEDGRSLILFPEGTSTSGLSVKPFKSSLFSLAEANGRLLDIQPVTIAVLETDGRKAFTKEDNDIYAWPLEMETPMPVHLWQFAKTQGAKLAITFHPSIRTSAGDDRKELAKACHDSVSKGLETARKAA